MSALQPASVLLFDMDGTLIDTEKYYRICWPQACHEFGYPMTDEQSLTMRSLGRPFVFAHFIEMFGTDKDYVQIRARRQELMNEMIRTQGIQCMPHTKEALSLLKEKGYRLAVTTASDLERTEKYLSQVGLRNFFDDLVCATMVKQGKPAPDLYRFACEKLGVAPANAIAVEDSPNGIRSAYGAGCQTVMIPDQSEPDESLMSCITARFDHLLAFAEALPEIR